MTDDLIFSTGELVIGKPILSPSFTINGPSWSVTIKPDGTVEYGEGYTPDAAAKIFWDAVGLERKERLP